MREHDWRNGRDGTQVCGRPGCTVIRYAEGGTWQKKKGGRWRRVDREEIPECAGEDATEKEHLGTCDAVGCVSGEYCGASAVPSASPLARVREALEVSANNGNSRPQRMAKDALPVLSALEAALPVLMESHHALKRIQFKGGHGAIRWQDCSDCRALLEGK